MEFKLIFRGDLPSGRYATPETKHKIRRALHPQLKTLWQEHPTLRRSSEPNTWDKTKRGLSRIEELATDNAKFGFRWVPLVKKNDFACSLTILLLLRQDPFRVFDSNIPNRGDLDRRIITLVDGLHIPTQQSELGQQVPGEGENPFFVLMDDDQAIFEFQVTVERLLIPPEVGEPDRDVTAIIGVRVTTLGGNPIGYMSGEF